MARDYKKIGSFELSQPVMRVSDPCYDKDAWCAGTIANCRTGIWNAAIVKFKDDLWGERVTRLVAVHESWWDFDVCDDVWAEEAGLRVNLYYRAPWEVLDAVIGVDSGQCGFFDDKFYQDDSVINYEPQHNFENPWYNACCDETLCEQNAGVIPYGAVSSSGFGDGSYDCQYHKGDDGLVDAVCVIFIADEAEDEVGDEDEEW